MNAPAATTGSKHAVGPLEPFEALRSAMAEAAALGAKFRLSGAGVVIGGLDEPPAGVRRVLADHAELLWDVLGGSELDEPALDLSDQLGVMPVLIEDRATARRAVRQLIRDSREHNGTLGFDIETAPNSGSEFAAPCWAWLRKDGHVAIHQPKETDRVGLDPYRARIQTAQFYAGGAAAFVFRGEALELVLRSHWLRQQHLLVHNLAFELAFLRHHCKDYRLPPGRRAIGRFECSMQATGLLHGVGFGRGRSIATAAEVFLGLTVPKDLQTSDWGAEELSPGQIAYAASDAILAWRLWPILECGLRNKDRRHAYALQRAAIPPVVDMQLRGIGIDLEEHRRQTDRWAEDLAAARQQYTELTGERPPANPKEIRAWLEKVLSDEQRAEWARTRAGLLSAQKRALKPLVMASDENIAQCANAILKMSRAAKLISAFGPTLANLVNPVTSRLHPSFNLAAAKSGRFSASNPNLQQFPKNSDKGFRKCIVAAPGNVLVVCDWSQVELRAAAWITGDIALTERFATGCDLHNENAAMIAGVPLEAVTDSMRSAAKVVSFGVLYGMGPQKLALTARTDWGVNMSIEEAQAARTRFFDTYPRIREWQRENADQCQRAGQVVIGCGRVVEAAWEYRGELTFNQCCNLPIQGVCADAMLRAILLVQKRLIRANIRGGLVATVHDELLLEVVEEDGEAAREILEGAMLDAFVETFPGAPTTNVAEAKVGQTWADAH